MNLPPLIGKVEWSKFWGISNRMKPIHLHQTTYVSEAVNKVFLLQQTGRLTEYGLQYLVLVSILVFLSAGVTMPSYYLIDLWGIKQTKVVT